MEVAGAINNESLAYRFAYVYGPLDRHNDRVVDRCRYYRNVVYGMAMVAFLSVIGGGVAALMFGYPLAHIAAMLTLQQWLPVDMAGGAYVVWAAICVLVVWGCIAVRKQEKRDQFEAQLKSQYGDEWRNHLPVKQPSQLVEWYRAFKERTCVKLEVKQ